MLRYLLVGVWNTAFGYSVFAVLTYLLTDRVPYYYMVASAVAQVINVTVAFFSYKRFVFRTEGGLLRQYLRCHIVYGATFAVNFMLLPLFVLAFMNQLVGPERYVPYLVGAILTLGTALASFFAHKHFSFAGGMAPGNAGVPGVIPVAPVAISEEMAQAD